MVFLGDFGFFLGFGGVGMVVFGWGFGCFGPNLGV